MQGSQERGGKGAVCTGPKERKLHFYGLLYILRIYVTGFWKTDHIVMREINRISMFVHL